LKAKVLVPTVSVKGNTFALILLCSSATLKLPEPNKDQKVIPVEVQERLNFLASEVWLAKLLVTSPDPLGSLLLSCLGFLPSECVQLSSRYSLAPLLAKGSTKPRTATVRPWQTSSLPLSPLSVTSSF